MAVKQIFVSDVSGAEGTETSPVATRVLPTWDDAGNLSLREVDLTDDEYAAYVKESLKAGRKYLAVSRETEHTISDGSVKSRKGSGSRNDRDLTPVRKWLKSQTNPDGSLTYPDLKDSGRIPADLMDKYNAAHGPSAVPSTQPPAPDANTEGDQNTDGSDANADANAPASA